MRGLAAQVLEQSRGELMAALSGPDPGAPHASAKRRRASPEEAPLAARLIIRVAARDQAKLRRRLVQSLHALGREFKPRTHAEARAWSVTVALAPTLRPESVARKRKPRG